MSEATPMDQSSNRNIQQTEEEERHRQCVEELRNIFLQVHHHQQQPEKNKDELNKIYIRGMHLLNNLRSLNRSGRIRIQKTRESTIEHRTRLDDQMLEQQTLLYELSHVNREITRCEEFKSKDQQLELVSVEDFYANAPPELTDPEITKNDPHRLHLFQLDWELMQREKLNEECKSLQTEICDLKKQIVRRRKRLRSLRPKLKQIVKSTEPVRRYIEPQFDESNNLLQSINNPLINKLPDPLYVLYSLILAYQQCDGRHISCQIDSKEDPANSSNFSFQNENNADGSSMNPELLMRTHPIHVKLTVIISTDHTGELFFSYLPNLNLVTVQFKLSGLKAQHCQHLTSTLLHNLLDENDNGNLSPNPTTDFLFLQHGKSAISFSDSNVGFPYRWLQQLCKCQMVPIQRQETISDCSEVMKRLTQRMRSRIALDRILLQLEKCEMPLLAEGQETTSILNSTLKRSISNLTGFRSWREINFDEVHKQDHVQSLIQENLIDRATTSIYECKLQSLTHDDNNKYSLIGHVFIPANYPQARSIILIKFLTTTSTNKILERTRLNNENIKILERSLLMDIVSSTNSATNNNSPDFSQHWTLLAQQLWRLIIAFPSLLDAENNAICTTRRRQTLSTRLID